MSDSIALPAAHVRAASAASFTALAWAVLFKELTFLLAYGLLRTSIQWPYSLGLDSQVLLPLIHDHQRIVFAGYYAYLLSSLMLVPVAVFMRHAFARQLEEGQQRWLDAACAFALVAAVMKMLGIIRWLFAAPLLAGVYANSSDPARRELTVLTFEALNAYAGQIGEHIGVHLASACFLLAIGVTLIRLSGPCRWLGRLAIPTALLLLPYGDVLRIETGLLTIAGPLAAELWFIGLAIVAFRRGRAVQ